MIEWLKQFADNAIHFNSVLAICLYWVPVSLCIVGYTLRTARNLRLDLTVRRACKNNWARGNPESRTLAGMNYYTPTDTIGSLIGRAFVSLMPIANIWAAMFDVAPEMFGKLFKRLEIIFNQPLVPKEDKHGS